MHTINLFSTIYYSCFLSMLFLGLCNPGTTISSVININKALILSSNRISSVDINYIMLNNNLNYQDTLPGSSNLSVRPNHT